MCWHVYGLLHRADHNYNEAIKAYKQALKIDSQNFQILRDLSMLQIQMRDLNGFCDSRYKILNMKSSTKVNWMAFCLSKYLLDQHAEAVKVIDSYLSTANETQSKDFESSELALFKNQILAQMDVPTALHHLSEIETIVVDKGAFLTAKATYEYQLKMYDKSKQTVLNMFGRGMTENYRLHCLLQCVVLELEATVYETTDHYKGTKTIANTVVLTDAQIATLREIYRELYELYPKSYAIRSIPVSMMEADEFKTAVDGVCRKSIVKGAPSLCAELHSLLRLKRGDCYVDCTDPFDVASHENYQLFCGMADQYIGQLESVSKFDASDPETVENSCLFWAWFLRASLHEIAGQYEQGLELVKKCIDHTPKNVDVYELQARLLRGLGLLDQAVDVLDAGRELDLSDRYINNMTTKYMLMAGREEEALKRISLFTKEAGDPERNLYDMQANWYELGLAACLHRKKDYGRALKKYFAIVKHFEDYQEDQFDFHSYCLRKVTLRAYVSVLKYEDYVFGHPFFCEAAAGIIQIYLYLMDHPIEDETKEPDYSKMTAAEKKKAKAIARKKKKASEKKQAQAKNGNSGNNNNSNAKNVVVDEDPLGKEYLKKDPLGEAKKLSLILSKYAPKNIDTWILQYDVSVRNNKPLLALQAICKATAIDENHPDLFVRLVDFGNRWKDMQCSSNTVQAVLHEEAPKLFKDKSVNDFIQSRASIVREEKATNLQLRTAVCRALVNHNIGSREDALSMVLADGMNGRGVSMDTCRETLEVLQQLGDDAAIRDWTDQVEKRFPGAVKN